MEVIFLIKKEEQCWHVLQEMLVENIRRTTLDNFLQLAN